MNQIKGTADVVFFFYRKISILNNYIDILWQCVIIIA